MLYGCQAHRYQLGLILFIERIKIRLGLEEVHIDIAVVVLLVVLYVIGKHLDVELNPFLGQDRLDQLQQFSVRYWRRCNAKFFGVHGGASQKRKNGCGRYDFFQEHAKLLKNIISGSASPTGGHRTPDRKSGGEGKRVSVSVDLGGGRIIKKK